MNIYTVVGLLVHLYIDACVLRNEHNVKLSKSFDAHHHSGCYMPPYSKTTDRRLSLYSHHKCVHGTMAYTGHDGALSCWKRLQLNSDGNNTLGDMD